MKTKTFSALILVVLNVCLFAQSPHDFEMNWGPEIRSARNSTIGQVIGSNSKSFFTKKLNKSKIVLQRYDMKMNLVQEEELDMKQSTGDKTLFEGLLYFQDNILLFSNFPNKKQRVKYLFYQTVDPVSMKKRDDLKKVAEISFEGKGMRNSGSYSYTLSPDSAMLLIQMDAPFERKERERLSLMVLDENLNERWKEDVEIPYEDGLFSIQSTYVDDEGNAYILGKLYDEKLKITRKGEVNFRYKVIAYKNKGTEVKEYDIEAGEDYITDLKLRILDNGDIICAGFYSEEGTRNIKGTLYAKLDGKTGDRIQFSTKDFDPDFIVQNLTEKQEKKARKKIEKGKNVEMFEYDLDHLILRNDGAVILVAEQFYERVVTSTVTDSNGNTSTRTTRYYYFNDIILVSIDPDGQIEWTEKIGKRQVSTNDRGFFSSYQLSIVDDWMYFIFNDNEFNLNLMPTAKIKYFRPRTKGMVVTMVSVNSNGKLERDRLFSSMAAEVLIRPVVSSELPSDKTLLFGQFKKSHRFGMLEFKR